MQPKGKVVAGFGLGALLVIVGACNQTGRSDSGPASASRSGATEATCVFTTELRGPGFSGGAPVAINARGQVTGSGDFESSGFQAFLWDGQTVLELAPLPGAGSVPIAINDDGWVVGYSRMPDGTSRATLWRNGTVIDLGGLGGTSGEAHSINNLGQIVGFAQLSPDKGGYEHAVLWDGGVVTDLGTLGGNASSALQINDRGQVIGSAARADGHVVSYLWENGVMTDVADLFPGTQEPFVPRLNQRGDLLANSNVTSPDGGLGAASYLRRADGTVVQILPFPAATSTTGFALNDVGQVIVTALGAGDSYFVWQDGAPTKTLGDAPGREINNAGQVIGTFFGGRPAGFKTRAFSWKDGELTYLGPADQTTDAVAINDRGQIAGVAPSGAVIWEVSACASADGGSGGNQTDAGGGSGGNDAGTTDSGGGGGKAW